MLFLTCAAWEGEKKTAFANQPLESFGGLVAVLRVFIVKARNLRQTWFGLRKPRWRNLLNAQEWQLSYDKESNYSIGD